MTNKKWYIKVIQLVFICCLLSNYSFSQKSKADSLEGLLIKEKTDTGKVILLWKLADVVSNYNPDRAVVLSRQAFLLADSVKDIEGASRSLGIMANTFIKLGNYARALEYQFKKLQIEEKRKNPRNLASVLMNIGVVHIYQEQYKKSLQYYNLSDSVISANNLQDLIYYSALNLGDVYDRLLLADSAFIYFSKALLIARKINDPDLIGTAMTGLGHSYLKKKNYPLAMANYRSALAYLKASNDDEIYCEAALGIAKLFQQINQPDSAVYYATRSNVIANADGFLKINLESAKFLATYYKQQKNIDSAFEYINKVQTINDTINSITRIREAQIITSNEQLRQLDMEESQKEAYQKRKQDLQQFYIGLLISGLVIFMLIATLLYRNNREKQQTNKVLKTTLSNLKSTQSQLIQSEKMASLGELTAGIAHEIQNPLNFVNNFSEVNTELIDELKAELVVGNMQYAIELANDIKDNEEKINHHGKRADAIVKGMLQHSRSSSGQKEPTDINALCDEYLRLSYHGLRAKDKSFNATIKTDFDESIDKMNIIPQDIGRVLLNLLTNAFYAVGERSKAGSSDKHMGVVDEKMNAGIKNYQPTVSISTKKVGDKVLISVSDNGNGIPQKIIEKIFQPFFTTKPTGQGTGLGLSLSYDIVKAHGGELKVETEEGKGTEFIIQLPVV